ncbi:MAG: diguanylate cyclase, partial [Caulobacteraceae bacterium]|nr:diguanylate cyclase [Caulobacter sp.]
MARFLLGRAVQSLILLALVSGIGFAVLHLAPGGPLAQF